MLLFNNKVWSDCKFCIDWTDIHLQKIFDHFHIKGGRNRKEGLPIFHDNIETNVVPTFGVKL